jgi:hypothetical protein
LERYQLEMRFCEAVVREIAEAFQGIGRPAFDIVRFNAETIAQRLPADPRPLPFHKSGLMS